jgi:intraflagellar transport protein 172
VQLCASHDERRYEEVAIRAARLMQESGSWEKAGDLFASGSRQEDAVKAYLRAHKFRKAREAAKEARSAALERQVDAEERAFDEGRGDISALDKGGHLHSAVSVLVQQGKWDSALERVAKADAKELLEEIVPKRINTLLGAERDVPEAVRLLATYGAPVAEGLGDMYMRLTQAAFAGPRTKACPPSVIASLRDVLYKVAAARRSGATKTASATAAAASASASSSDSATIERALMACHYSAMASEAQRMGLKDVSADSSISLLRYCGVVPADRAFHEAGVACKAAGRLNVAYVMMNRLLDLTEALEDGDASGIDNTDFEGTDIPTPLDFPLPTEAWLSAEETEEDVRSWILSASVDDTIQQTLNDGDLPSASQSSQNRCAITGLPVSASDRVACTSCGSVAVRAAWNAMVAKTGTCAWCNEQQSPVY